MSNENAIVPAAQFGERGIQIADLRDLYQFAKYVVASRLAPSGLDSPEKVLVAVQTGMEAGLRPMASLRAVYVVNGAPSWTGDAALGLVRASGLLAGITKSYLGEGDDLACEVTVLRKGDDLPMTERFSISDAKEAGYLPPQSPKSPWKKHPKRMLYYRALGFVLRDTFSDVLGNLHISEELLDDLGDGPLRAEPRDVTPPPTGVADPLFDEATKSPEILPPEEDDGKQAPDVPEPGPAQAAGVSPEIPPPANLPTAEEALGSQVLSRLAGPEDDLRDDEERVSVPSVKLTTKPRRTRKALAQVLSDVEHWMSDATIKEWTKEQMMAAWDWAWEMKWIGELAAAGHPDADEPNPMPRPSFIPEYGNNGPPVKPPPDSTKGFCGKTMDLEGTACGEAAGHQGPCVPR
jgi:hypothetical protein